MSANQGKQSHRELRQYYSELKKPTMIGLVPTAVGQLDELAEEFQLSRSEFVEQIARHMVPVGTPWLHIVSSMDERDAT